MSFKERVNNIFKIIKDKAVLLNDKTVKITIKFFKDKIGRFSLRKAEKNKLGEWVMHKRAVKKFSVYVDGVLTDDEKNRVEEHILKCDDCREKLEQHKRMINALSETVKEELPIGFSLSLHEKLVEVDNPVLEEKSEKNKLLITWINKLEGVSWQDKLKKIRVVLFDPRVYVPVLSALMLVSVFASGVYKQAEKAQNAYVNDKELDTVTDDKFKSFNDEKQNSLQSEAQENSEADSVPVQSQTPVSSKAPERSPQPTSATEKNTVADSGLPATTPVEGEQSANVRAFSLPQTNVAANENGVMYGGETQHGNDTSAATAGTISAKMMFTESEEDNGSNKVVSGGGGGGTAPGGVAPDSPAMVSAPEEPAKKVYVYQIKTGNVSGVISVLNTMGKIVYSEGSMKVLVLTREEYNKVLENLDYNEINSSYLGMRDVTKSYEKDGYCRIEILSK